jgi:hypothetical protein
MGCRSIIWKNKLENYVLDLFYKQRKNYNEIAEIILKEKKVDISREAIRNFINKNAQDKTA